jgi:site-specific recombinase XerC
VAGPFEAEVGSFRLHLAAEGKAERTLHNYAEAVRWFLRWLAIAEDRTNPVTGLGTPKAEPGLVPVFTSEDLSALRRQADPR